MQNYRGQMSRMPTARTAVMPQRQPQIAAPTALRGPARQAYQQQFRQQVAAPQQQQIQAAAGYAQGAGNMYQRERPQYQEPSYAGPIPTNTSWPTRRPMQQGGFGQQQMQPYQQPWQPYQQSYQPMQQGGFGQQQQQAPQDMQAAVMPQNWQQPYKQY